MAYVRFFDLLLWFFCCHGDNFTFNRLNDFDYY